MPRRLGDNPVLQPGWSRHGDQLGFSYKRGDLRADMEPVNVKGRTYVWGAMIWRGTDRANPLWEGGDDSYWELADQVVEECERLSREEAA